VQKTQIVKAQLWWAFLEFRLIRRGAPPLRWGYSSWGHVKDVRCSFAAHDALHRQGCSRPGHMPGAAQCELLTSMSCDANTGRPLCCCSLVAGSGWQPWTAWKEGRFKSQFLIVALHLPAVSANVTSAALSRHIRLHSDIAAAM
jgi:hypothetical protein